MESFFLDDDERRRDGVRSQVCLPRIDKHGGQVPEPAAIGFERFRDWNAPARLSASEW
jgi:hypothetical protein